MTSLMTVWVEVGVLTVCDVIIGWVQFPLRGRWTISTWSVWRGGY